MENKTTQEYAYKPTTHGRAIMAACMAMEKPFHITRVAFGCGKVDVDTNLANVHKLLEYVSEGTVTERRHQDNRFEFTIQYANSAHQNIKTFLLSEFVVYAEDPTTGGETDLIYGSLGDYRQPVPAYNPRFPPSVFNFPLTLILSDDLIVAVSAPSGLVTHEELAQTVERALNSSAGAPGGNATLDSAGMVPAQQLPWQRRVISTRSRDPGKPTYGLGGEVAAVLSVGPYTGTAPCSAVVSGTEYDALNLSVNGDTAPDGTIILKKAEE